MKWPWLLAALALCVTGCATGRRLAASHRPDAQNAYIYGRFTLAGDTTLNLGGPGVTFQIRCRDGQTYDIDFQRGVPLQLIAIKPGICQIEDIIYDDGRSHGHVTEGAARAGLIGAVMVYAIEGDQTPRQMSGFRLLHNEELQPGGVYYVGDFTLTARDNRSSIVRHYNWTYKIRNNYAATTEQMKRAHPPFASVATENRMSP